MGIKFEPGLTVKDALDMVFGDVEDENETNPIEAVFIAPPDNAGFLTDEDSGDEDDITIENLNRNQLLAEAEVVRYHQEDIVPWEKNIKRTWIEGQFQTTMKDFPSFSYEEYSSMSPVQLFELFFDDEIVNFLASSSNEYAQFLNCNNPKITPEEVKVFVAILIISGYNRLPGRRHYWDGATDMCNDLVKNSMRRNRFEQILRFFHCADNSAPNPQDKMWKLRPLVKMVQNNCRKNFIPEQQLSFDESMIKYFGRHGCKQFIRGKPIRFGYKVWCLNTILGYLVDFEIYQGKSINVNEFYEKLFGKATAPLLGIIDNLPENKKLLPYHFYFDNLFTTVDLLRFLKERGYYATGTIRENRIPKNKILPPNKDIKKNARGTHKDAICKEDGVVVVKWVDNAVVSIASNCHGVHPISSVKRYSRQDKKSIQVPRPYILGEYNKYMGGTDRMDENIAKYRINARNKKWYWPILTWLIDVCINNAWVLKRKSNNMPQLQFRREIAQAYLSKYGESSKGAGRPRSSTSSGRVLTDIRYDGVNHLVTKIPDGKKRRCNGDRCKSIMRTMCIKCKVGICVDCFVNYHKQ